MFRRQSFPCLYSLRPVLSDRASTTSASFPAFPRRSLVPFAPSLLLAVVLAGGMLSPGHAQVAVPLESFSPDSSLNRYWMYMDSTIRTSNGTFSTADEGNVGAGDSLLIANGGRFKTPTIIRRNVTGEDAKEKWFDSSLWVLGNASLAKTYFTSSLSKVQIDGTLDYSNNGGTDSAETWVGGKATFRQNTAFLNKLHLGGDLDISSTPVTFDSSVFYDPAKIVNPLMAGLLGAKGVPTTAYTPPFATPVFFDSTKLPGYGLSLVPPVGRLAVGADYVTAVCPSVGGCTNYPGVVNGAKSIPSGKVLPPGYYGNLTLNTETVILGEGIYYFDKVALQNTGSKIVAYQPTGERTIIYVRDGLATNSGGIFIGPDSGFLANKFGLTDSPDDFSGGTMMIVGGPAATLQFDSDAYIWATLSTPTGKVSANSQLHLYGQMFGRHFYAANNFDGGAGKFIPFYSKPPVISFDVDVFSATVAEPDLKLDETTPDTVLARFPLKMDHINGARVIIWYHTAPVTAQGGGATALGTHDYVPVTKGSVAIEPTFDTASIVIRVLGDVVYEGNETFRVVLDSVTNGDLGPLATDSFGVGTIIDNDNALKVRLVPDGPTSLERPWASDTAFGYRLEAIDPATNKVVKTKVGISVKLKLVPVANTTVGTDVVLPVPTVSFLVGDSSVKVRVVVPRADRFGPDQIFQLVIDSSFGAKKADSVVADTLKAPPAALVIGDGTANQSTATSLALPVRLVRVADGQPVRSSVVLPYTWKTLDGTARAGTHFVGVPAGTSGSYPANVLTDSVRVSLIRVPLVDSTRSFRAVLVPGAFTRLSAAPDTGVGTILNGWPKPAISMRDTTVARQKTDFVLKVPVRLSQGATFPSAYTFQALDGGAVNGTDFVLTPGAGSISGTDTIRITIKGSAQLDSTRRFRLLIPTWDATKLASVAAGSDTVAVITLTNAVSGARVVVDDATVDQSSATQIRFPVRLVDASGVAITTRIPVPYTYSTIDGSAKGGTHFAGASSVLDTLRAGISTDTFPIALIVTTKYDTTRHFQVEVAAVAGLVGVVNTRDTATGTILNGFAKPTIRIDSASILRPKVKTPLEFRVWLDRASAIELPFSWSTRDGSALAGTDYAAVTSTSATIRDSLRVSVGILARGNEYDTLRRFHVDLSALGAFANATATAPGRLIPVLGAPWLVVLPASVEEGAEGQTPSMVFRVELRDSVGAAMASRLETRFQWATIADTSNGVDSLAYPTSHGAFPLDYFADDDVGVVAIGDKDSSFAVLVRGNALKQVDRAFFVRIHGAVSARLDSASANFGTILDDDSISTRAYFPVASTSLPESVKTAWVPVRLTAPALFADTLYVDVNTRTTGIRGTNYELLQPAQTDVHDTTKVPATTGTRVRLVVEPGDSLFWLPVKILHDTVRTIDLRLFLDLSMGQNPAGLKVDPGRAQTELLLVNIDPPPYLGFRDTTVTVVRGASTSLRVGVRPLRSDKDPSAQYTGTLSDPTGATSPSWTGFVSTAISGSTPTFTRLQLDNTMSFGTKDDGRDGPALRAVLRLRDWTAGEALKPLAGDTVLHDSVVVWITNGNAPSKVSFPYSSLVVKDIDGEVSIKVLLDRASNWSTSVGVSGKGVPASVQLPSDSSVILKYVPGDTVATFVLRFGNDRKVGPDRSFDLNLGGFVHLLAGKDSVLHIRIQNTNLGPKVKITSPAEGAKLGKKDLDSLGKVPVSWTVDGKTMAPYDTLIPEGPSTLVKCYSDEWGNSGCDSVHVTLDTTAPKVVITAVSKDSGRTWLKTSPTDTPWVNRPGILVKWISIDNGDTTRHQDPETLKDTLATVTRCAEDAVGNRGCGFAKVGLDTIPPKVWIETPPNGSHWSAGCINTIWVEVDGRDTLRHDTLYCFRDAGPQTISVVSKPDRAGNIGKASTSIVIDPNLPGGAIYLDTDNDGRIDAVVVQFPRAWTDSLPVFDISYGDSGANLRTSVTASYGDASQAGVLRVVQGDTLRVMLGIPVLDASGKPVRAADGTILYQSPGGSPLLGKDGKQVRDSSGVPLWKVTGTGRDSSVLVLKLDPALAYGWTTSSVSDLGLIHATVTVLDSTGKPVTKDIAKTFDIQDGVAPVILSATIGRTEDYNGSDTLKIKVSEAVILDSSRNWLEIKVDGQWVKVPAENISVASDGTISILLPPGEEGVPDPGVEIRFLSGVTDSAGNRVVIDPGWDIVVEGGPRPPRLVVDIPNPIGRVSSTEQGRTRKSGFVITATNGGNRDDFSPWRPGSGYLGEGGDGQFRDICPDISECNGIEIEVNQPMRMQVYVYDLIGVSAGGFGFQLTQDDLDEMNPDKLDRFRIRILWNQRGHDGRVVASGIYPWRVITWTETEKGGKPTMSNGVINMGVKTRLD